MKGAHSLGKSWGAEKGFPGGMFCLARRFEPKHDSQWRRGSSDRGKLGKDEIRNRKTRKSEKKRGGKIFADRDGMIPEGRVTHHHPVQAMGLKRWGKGGAAKGRFAGQPGEST